MCRALNLDPNAPDILSTLKDPVKVPWETITKIIETEELGPYGTFRGCLADDWVTVEHMAWQRSGELGRELLAHGVKCVVIGDLTEEWYLYSIAHPIKGPQDILPNLERYFPTDVARNLIKEFQPRAPLADLEEAVKLFGEILSCGQVHLPVRMFAKDMAASGFPVLRYEIRWTPEQSRTAGESPSLIMKIYPFLMVDSFQVMSHMVAIECCGPCESQTWSRIKLKSPKSGSIKLLKR